MIVIEANYSKKLGLPEYSSHQYSITLRSEVSDLSKVQQESDRLYGLLQSCVDRSLQQAGFVPNGKNGNGHHRNGNGNGDHWDCSPKQKELILKIVDENRMEKTGVEKTSQELFGKPVKSLNKMEASGLIEELLRQSGAVNGNGKSRFQTAGSK
jgi:hypothetical protein